MAGLVPAIHVVMAGIAVRRTASLRSAYVPAIHSFVAAQETWMPGTRPGMTYETTAPYVTLASSAIMSSSDIPKWWPISCTSTCVTMAPKLSSFSAQ
jgi:hypothetical protein